MFGWLHNIACLLSKILILFPKFPNYSWFFLLVLGSEFIPLPNSWIMWYNFRMIPPPCLCVHCSSQINFRFFFKFLTKIQNLNYMAELLSNAEFVSMSFQTIHCFLWVHILNFFFEGASFFLFFFLVLMKNGLVLLGY